MPLFLRGGSGFDLLKMLTDVTSDDGSSGGHFYQQFSLFVCEGGKHRQVASRRTFSHLAVGGES
jgi:hypothetical protein